MPHRPDRLDRKVLATITCAGIVCAMQVGKVAPAIPELRRALGLGLVTAGWLASLVALCAALFAVPAALLIRRCGAARSLVYAMGVLSLGSALGALSPGTALLIVARALEGVGFLGLGIAAPTVIVTRTPAQRRSLALGIWGTYIPAGMAIAMAVSPWILEAAGFRALWAGNALLCLLLAVMLQRWVVAGDRQPAPPPAATTPGGFLRQRGPWLYAAVFALTTLQYFSVMSWLPSYLIEQQHIGLRLAAGLTALVVSGSALGSLSGGWLMHRLMRRWQLLVCAFVLLMITVYLVWNDHSALFTKVAAALLFSYCVGGIAACCLAGPPAYMRSADDNAVANAMPVHGSNTGVLLGPPLVAWVVSHGQWSDANWVLWTASLLGLLLAALIRLSDGRGADGG